MMLRFGQGPLRAGVVCLLLSAGASASHADDVPVNALKLQVMARASHGLVRTLLVMKGDGITKDAGIDPAQISATLRIRMNERDSSFSIPQGVNWKKNNEKSATYVNSKETSGVRTSALVVGKRIKFKSLSLGTPAMHFSLADSGPIYATYTVVNSGVTERHCARFDRSSCTLDIGDPGDYNFKCKDGVEDTTCGGECRTVAGVQWCFKAGECGQACQDVCTALGKTLIDDTAWSEAQDTELECQAISTAFGISEPVQFSNWQYGCLEDETYDNTGHSAPRGPLYCSSDPACPAAHRTNMDLLGAPCTGSSRRSICPCQ